MGTRRTRPNDRGGFTLLELMIAGVLMVVAVMTAMATQVRTLDLVKTTREISIATGDLQAAMEQIIALPIDSIPVAGSLFADDQAIAAFNGLHLDGQTITCDYPGYVIGGAVPSPLPIVLTASWNDWRGRVRTLELRTARTR